MDSAWQSVAVALAIGLLVGAERERAQAGARLAGVRTFALAALAGAIAAQISPVVLGVVALCAAGFMVAGFFTDPDHATGATTEIALVVVVLLGGLTATAPALAAAAGVATAVTLVAKDDIHRFVREKINHVELVDALKFFVVAFIVLPLVPHARLGPYGVIDPRKIWILVVAVTALGWLGYVAVRVLGPHRGLPAAGLAGGFVSGAATTGAMARLARAEESFRPAVAGALLASVATLIQLVIVTTIADRRVGALLLPAAAMAAVILIAEAGWLILRPGKVATAVVAEPGAGPAESLPANGDADARRETQGPTLGPTPGLAGRRPFELMPALLLAVILTVLLVVAAFAADVLGTQGSVVAIALAGLADAHAGALTAATLAGQGTFTTSLAVLAAAAALAVNTAVKLVLAYVAGGQRVCATLAALFAGPVATFAIGLAVTLGVN